MRNRGGRRAAPNRAPGQSLVELALVMGVLLLLILGGIDAMQILTTQFTVSQAVRAAAHQAALIGGPDGSDGNVQTAADAPTSTIAQTARLILNSGMTTSAAKATITVTCADPASGAARSPCRRYDAITVRITYRDDVWAPIGPFRTVAADVAATRSAEKDQQ